MKESLRIVVVPDSFKGSLSSIGAAEAIEKGILSVADAQINKIPMADGGEGTVEAMVAAMGGEIRWHEVTGPLGEKVRAFYGLLEDGKTGVIEVAAASGLTLIPEYKRNPMKTTSFGTGEQIKKALDDGCTRLIIGLGGSATNDGGMGIAQALGTKFLDIDGVELGLGGEQLQKVWSIDISGTDNRLKHTEITAMCDVRNPLCGPNGAAFIFSPQKGASPEMVEVLDKGLENLAEKIQKYMEIDIKNMPGAGAAGGIGGGLLAFANCKLKSGVQTVIEASNMEEIIREADLVITGEGKTDGQTILGKVPFGIGRIAKKYSVPVICISGAIDDGYEALYDEGITGVYSIIDRPMSLSKAMEEARILLERATVNVIRLYNSSK